MKEKIPIRLCIVSSMRTIDHSKMQSFELSQSSSFGDELEQVVLLLHGKKFSKNKLKNNVHVYTIPSIEHKSWIWFGLSIILTHFLTFPILIRIIKKYKINLIRSDDSIINGLPSVLAAKFLKIPIIT